MVEISPLSSSLAFCACHVCFYAVFVPRWLLRHRGPGPEETADDGSGSGPVPAQPGPVQAPAAPAPDSASRLPLALHAVAMGVLYAGIDAAFLGAAPRFLVAPQRAAGGLTMLAGAALAAWALAVFKSWRLQARIGPRHELCTAGPFRRVRHPIYLAMDLLALGSWLWLPTLAVALGVALVASTGALRARGEEQLLLRAYGARYETYRRQTWRFLPGVY
jgi:protein-S-isoprenylcysteine O-methyltransferase Ste14